MDNPLVKQGYINFNKGFHMAGSQLQATLDSGHYPLSGAEETQQGL